LLLALIQGRAQCLSRLLEGESVPRWVASVFPIVALTSHSQSPPIAQCSLDYLTRSSRRRSSMPAGSKCATTSAAWNIDLTASSA